MTQEGSYRSIGRITRPQGLDGAVRIDLLLDDDRHFESGRRVVVGHGLGESVIEEFRRQHGRFVLKLRGVNSIDAATKLVGAEIRIPAADVLPPEEGKFYTFDLKGCRVFDGERRIGVVTDVLSLGGPDILQLDDDGRERLVPFAEAYLRNVDVANKRIDMELPEGLLDING